MNSVKDTRMDRFVSLAKSSKGTGDGMVLKEAVSLSVMPILSARLIRSFPSTCVASYTIFATGPRKRDSPPSCVAETKPAPPHGHGIRVGDIGIAHGTQQESREALGRHFFIKTDGAVRLPLAEACCLGPGGIWRGPAGCGYVLEIVCRG